MFSWICPQCGAEVPPAYNECPNCKPAAVPPPLQPQPAAAPPPPPPAAARMSAPPTPTAPPVYAAAPIAPAAPPPQIQYVYAKQPGPPAWLVTLGVFAGLLAAGFAFYSLVLNKKSVAAPSETAMEQPAAAVPSKGAAKLAKYLEAAGVRIVEENKKPQIRLMLINHSGAEMVALVGTVTLGTQGKDGEIAEIPFTLGTLGAYEAKEIKAPLKTKLRAYELPDWQFIKPSVTLTAAE